MYYYNDGENEVGPFSLEKLQLLSQSGLIGKGTLVRTEESDRWVPLHRIIGNQQTQTEEPGLPAASYEADRGSPEPHDTPHQPQQSEKGVDDGPAPAPATATGSAGAAGSEPASSVSGWPSQPPTPWRRYGARILDTSFNGLFGIILFSIGFFAIAPDSADSFFSIFESGLGRIADVVLTTVLASIIGGAMIGVSGFTLGKLIFGVKITRADGKKLGLVAGWTRDFSVLLRGMGLGIPIIALFTMWFSFKTLTDTGSTNWDRGQYIASHRPSGAAQYCLNLIGITLIVLMFGAFTALNSA